ncbi:MAG TPA: aminoglycoside phosphotransferase family protein [Anaerolineae bacterium]
MVLSFLHQNRQRLGLAHYGVPERLTAVMITPRFRASSHIVFLVLPQDRPEPVLVAKVPRLAGTSASVTREAGNLRMIEASRPGGFDSIPRLVAFETYAGHQLLLETALVGRPMDPGAVRHDVDGRCQAVIRWLVELQQATQLPAESGNGWLVQLLERPLRYFERVFPLTAKEEKWLAETWQWIEPLRQAQVPLVCEHGDLSHPNIFLLGNGQVGVVDWELAELQGLPAYDLFFFLTYVAFARSRAHQSGSYLPAFHDAFFGPAAWTKPYIADYARQMGLSSLTLTSLFVLSWARYMANLLLRLNGGEAAAEPEPLAAETADWLRGNRYYILWQHTLMHLDELNWHDIQPAENP